MPKLRPKPLKHRELLKKLKAFGVVEAPAPRGKGSERILILASGQGSKYQGPQIPVKHHGEGTEHSIRAIDSILRRFGIRPEDFWKD